MSNDLLRALLGGGVIALNRPLVQRFGYPAAAMLHEISYWCERAEDGWCFRTQEELEEAICLKPKTQFNQRKELEELGIIEVERRDTPARNFYRINLEALARHMDQNPAGFQNGESSSVKVTELARSNLPISPIEQVKSSKLDTPSSETISPVGALPKNVVHLGDARKLLSHEEQLRSRKKELRDWFDHWWEHYWPGEDHKDAARRAFVKINPDAAMMEKIAAGTQAWVESGAWDTDQGRYRPYPQNFLRNLGWTAKPPARKPEPDAYVSAVFGGA